MARTKITYEHPPDSGQSGCERIFDDDWILKSNHGDVRAADVQVGYCLQTAPLLKTRVVAVAPVVE